MKGLAVAQWDSYHPKSAHKAVLRIPNEGRIPRWGEDIMKWSKQFLEERLTFAECIETRFIASYESNLTMLCGYPLHAGVKGSVKGSFHDRPQQKLERVYWWKSVRYESEHDSLDYSKWNPDENSVLHFFCNVVLAYTLMSRYSHSCA